MPVRHEEYPVINAQARKDRAEIYRGDGTAVQNTANYARGYAVKEKPRPDDLIDFMERLLKSNERKIYLILDNLRVASQQENNIMGGIALQQAEGLLSSCIFTGVQS